MRRREDSVYGEVHLMAGVGERAGLMVRVVLVEDEVSSLTNGLVRYAKINPTSEPSMSKIRL